MAWITSIPVKRTRWKFTGRSLALRHVIVGEFSLNLAIRLISVHYCYSYRRNRAWTVIIWFLIIITGGLLRLIFHWVPHLMLLATHTKCSLEEAETILLIEKFQGKHTSYYVKKLRNLTAQDIMLVIFFYTSCNVDINKINFDNCYFISQ